MMKNSKLSKLLVAGVSVAMLASALAPMAFADEPSENAATTAKLTVTYALAKEAGSFRELVDTPVVNGFDGTGYTTTDDYETITRKFVSDSDVVALEVFDKKDYISGSFYIDLNGNQKIDAGDTVYTGNMTVEQVKDLYDDPDSVTTAYIFY